MSALPITGGKWSSSRKFKRGAVHRAARLQRPCCLESLETRLYLSTAAYTWQNVNITGGGFVDGIFYDPHNAERYLRSNRRGRAL